MSILITIVNMRKLPNITRISTSHVVSISIILLRVSYIIEIENEIFAFCEHEHVVMLWRNPLFRIPKRHNNY